MKTTIKASGFEFEDMVNELESVGGDLGEASLRATVAMLEVAEVSIRRQYGKSGDFIADSIGYNAAMGKDGKSAVGSVGVFKIDHIAGRHMKFKQTGGDKSGSVGIADPSSGLSAPQLAWWYEFGTRNITPKPFIESGWLLSMPDQEKAFTEAFNEVINEARNVKR